MTTDDIWAEPYITEWTEALTRDHVQGRSMGWCEWCGKEHGTDMHHRRNRSQGGEWHPANIVHLCRDCHRWVTNNPKDAEAVGLTLTHGQDLYDTPIALSLHDIYLHDNYLPKGRNA